MMSPEDSWVSKWQRISECLSLLGWTGANCSAADPSLGQWELFFGLLQGFLAAIPDEGASVQAEAGGGFCSSGCCHAEHLSVFFPPGNFKPGVYAVSVTGRLPQGNAAGLCKALMAYSVY